MELLSATLLFNLAILRAPNPCVARQIVLPSVMHVCQTDFAIIPVTTVVNAPTQWEITGVNLAQINHGIALFV